jgi:hypothetical protein
VATRPDDPGDEELAQLRRQPDNVHLLGGFGPLAVGVVLFVLMVLLAPTVAPEQVVEEPVGGTTSTTFVSGTTLPSTTVITTAVTAP